MLEIPRLQKLQYLIIGASMRPLSYSTERLHNPLHTLDYTVDVYIYNIGRVIKRSLCIKAYCTATA